MKIKRIIWTTKGNGFFILITSLFLFASSMSSAQMLVGPKFGIAFATMQYETLVIVPGQSFQSHALPSPVFGVVTEKKWNKFFFRPEALISFKAFNFNRAINFGDWSSYYNGRVSAWYIEIPLNLGFSFAIGQQTQFQLYAGPYLGLIGYSKASYSGYRTTHGTGGRTPIAGHLENSDSDIGFNLGLAFQFDNQYLVSFAYAKGLTNTNAFNENNNRSSAQEPTEKSRWTTISISLAYIFPAKD